jgi:superfamily II DNA helicase RecQ
MSGSLFPGVPILALTATASTQRKKEIASLRERNCITQRNKLHKEDKEYHVSLKNIDLFLQFPL